jgi:adenine/guanine phosphoribosyltransferase-like PRPP-binding protein
MLEHLEKQDLLDSDIQGAFMAHVREIEHFPIKNIVFKDIAPVLAQPRMLSRAVSMVAPTVKESIKA